MEGREEEAGIVADTNILISALLKDHSINARLIKSGYFNVYFPEYGLKEIAGYHGYIDAKRKRSSQIIALEYAQSFLLKAIQVVPLDLYRPKMKDAFEIMKEIEDKDNTLIKNDDIPPGCKIFIDSNIFIYHFLGRSEPCTVLLERAENLDVQAYTSVIVMTEVLHKLMIAEAVEKFGIRPYFCRHIDIVKLVMIA